MHELYASLLLFSCSVVSDSFGTPWTVAHQTPPSMGFSRQEYWSFSFSIIPSNEIPGLISFRMDWVDLLAVQGTLKSLLQHQKHQFFCAQLSL